MRRMHHLVVGLISAGAFLGPVSSPASAGFGLFGCGKKDCCQAESPQCNCDNKCSKPKRHCCLCPPEAPEAEIGFAQGGVIRPGNAVRVNEASMARAVREAAARDLKASPESAAAEKSTEDRLNAIETNVSKMANQIDRLTIAVEKLATSNK